VQDLDVTFAVDRAGIVGADGATHTGSFDIAYSRCIPNLVVMAPAHGEDMFELLNTAYAYPGPALVRYPRDSVSSPAAVDIENCVEIGKAVRVRDGRRTALLVFGSLYSLAAPLADELNLTLVNMRFIKPLDETLLLEMAENHDFLITLEDGCIAGGAGSAVLEYLNSREVSMPLLRLGLDDRFPSQGSREEVLEEYDISIDGLRRKIVEFTAEKVKSVKK